MEKYHEIDKLVSAREILKISIEKSRNITKEIHETGSRLDARSHNLAILEAGIKEMASGFAVHEIRGCIDGAVGPASAVLRVLDVVYELQDSLEAAEPIDDDIFKYITIIKRLEGAVKLLEDNCRLVTLWLEDAVRLLENGVACSDDNRYFNKLIKVVKILDELQNKGKSFRENGGVISSAYDKLECKYRHLLSQFSSVQIPCDSSFLSDNEEETYIGMTSSTLPPAPVIQQLQTITGVLAANNRLDRCISIYADVRTANVRASIRSLNADYYLDIPLCELDSVESIEDYIDHWDKHMEFAVQHLLRMEHSLCREVYQKTGGLSDDLWMSCFAKIAMQCGFREILSFGTSITRCKKEAIKLLKLLKIFSTLDKLRLDFNELFNGKFCIKIQNQTRDLVRKVVDGACEIFWELEVQVELQRASVPPPDGSIPRLVRFVTEYCNQLLADENSSILTRVLEIYQDWNNVKFEDGILSVEIKNIMRALEINLEIWAKRYDDPILSCLFMMNNHWYLCKNIARGTLLGDLMGNAWLSEHEKSVNRYAESYLKESWKKLLVLLQEEGLTLFPGGRAIDRNLVKERIGVFCEAFDDMYRKQSKWIVTDKGLRWKVCQLVYEAIVPSYESYLQRFMMPGLIEAENNDRGYYHVKYTAKSLENLISSLFQARFANYEGSKCTDLIDIKNSAIGNHLSSTPAAA